MRRHDKGRVAGVVWPRRNFYANGTRGLLNNLRLPGEINQCRRIIKAIRALFEQHQFQQFALQRKGHVADLSNLASAIVGSCSNCS